MMVEPAIRHGPNTAEDNGESSSDELSTLRDLLLAPEQTQLTDLQERLDNPVRYAEDVSRILPNAVALSLNRDDKLASALMPTVESSIGISVKKNPQRLVDAIFPVMGPAIRKAIANAFAEMVQSLNQSLEHSISLKGMKWRFEALRTGKSFAEVVLAHTLLYRVEQVFLIHRETGLLLQHVEAGASGVQDVDMVSGMLTAIQDFVHDSFGAERTDALDSMQVGELTVWIERGSHAVLASVIRGSAPLELRRVMQDALDAIQVEQHEALQMFTGDAAAFATSRPHLESCLQQSQKEAQTRTRPSPALIAGAVLILLAIGLWVFFSIRQSRRWDDYLTRLNSEPGLVVVSAERRGGKYHITGLRDPLAADPAALLPASNLDPQDVVARWEPYLASSSDLVLARMTRLLEPPSSVSLSVQDGALVARGSASHEWIINARKVSQLMPNVTRFADENLVDLDLARSQIDTVRRQLEQRAILFATGSVEIMPDQREELSRASAEIQKLEALSQSLGSQIRVEVWGHADQSGSPALNDRLIAERAEHVLSALGGGNRQSLEIADPVASRELREYTRSVTFKVRPGAESGAKLK
jgi:OOP family OmpA-OmpF porin